MNARRIVPLLSLAVLAFAAPAFAQAAEPSPHWGISASIAPWDASDRFKVLYEAKALDMSGQEFRIGITRGAARGNDWTLSFVKKTISAGGTMVDEFGKGYHIGERVTVTGVMAEDHTRIATIARRAQLGVIVGAGVAKADGMVSPTAGGPDIPASELFTLFSKEVNFQLLVRAELAASIAVAPGTKLRFSAGFDWPGQTRLGVTAMYFFGDR